MKHNIEYKIKSNVTEYNNHSLQLSKILIEKTKAHHDAIKQNEM